MALNAHTFKHLCAFFSFLQTILGVLTATIAYSFTSKHTRIGGTAFAIGTEINENQFMSVCFAEYMKMCSFIGYKHKSQRFVQMFLDENYQRPNL